MMPALGPYLFFVALSVCAYLNTLSHPFVHDEAVFILQNPHIGDLGGLFQVFFAPAANILDANVYYRPMLEALYRIEYLFFKFDPFWWHLFNIIVHGINAALVMRLIVLSGFTRSIAWAAAILFTVHPIQTESVACIAGVSNLLMAFFVLLCLTFYLKNRRGMSALMLVLALLTKEQAIFVVPLIVLIDWYRGRKPALAWGLMAMTSILFLGLRQMLTGSHIIADILASPGELKLRLLSIAQVILTNIRMLIFPYDLHYYRSTDILALHWPWWLGLMILGVCLVVLNRRFIWFGAGFFLLALSPVLNIIPLVNEYSLIMTMEHFLYVPMIGVMLVLCGLVARFCWGRAEGVLFACMIFFFFLTLVQNEYWQNEVVLFERMTAYEPNFGRGQYLLAGAYYQNKDFVLANEHFAKAYAIMDGYSRKAVGAKSQDFLRNYKRDILFDWAHSFEAMGHWTLARQKYEQAIVLDANDAKLWDNLGVLLVRSGKANEAVAYFEKALQVDPGFGLARQHLQQIK